MKNFSKLIIVGCLFLFFSIASIGSQLKDGVYRAEYKKFDKHGWKQFLELEIKDGMIISANSDSINKKRMLKSEDIYYEKNMKKKVGTYPSHYKVIFEEQLLEKQGVDTLDGVAGATSSFQNFRTLAEIILINAEKGKTKKIVLD